MVEGVEGVEGVGKAEPGRTLSAEPVQERQRVTLPSDVLQCG